MNKMGIWAIALPTVVTFSIVLLLVSSQLVYAPAPQANRATFSFDNAATGVIAKMQGGGMWNEVSMSINAAGSFTDATGITGSWRALSLVTATCPPCASPTTDPLPSPTTVAFSATFRPVGGAPFVAEVVIGPGADNGAGPTDNFWVGPPLLGFGTANVRIN